mgnify:CR=1 FL=1
MLRLVDRLLALAAARDPDVVIGGAARPYLLRWHVIPRNPIFNVYLHCFLRSDDDRAHHDHPWLFNISRILRNAYTQHTITAGGTLIRRIYVAGDWLFRWWAAPHRIELHRGPCWTLFITGPKVRSWGFYCPNRWVHWKEFTDADDHGAIGRGCGE